MNYTFNDSDVKLVEKFIDIRNKGMYADGTQLTEVYNRVLHKNATPTSCGSCLRARVNELEGALLNFKEKISKAEPQAKEETMKERMARVRAAKKEKK